MDAFNTLTGHDLKDAAQALGRSLFAAFEDNDPEALYVTVWLLERHRNDALSLDHVLGWPFSEISERFEEMNVEDPTQPPSGGS